MKPIRLATFILFASLCGVTFAQSHAHDSADKAPPTEAQKAFEKLKTVAGSWVGQVTTVPDAGMNGTMTQLSLRVTSRGNALAHEISVSGSPDHPLTMFYVDGDRLVLTHYCDAGNRPRMTGKLSPDGKTIEFDFLDLSGSNQQGHMDHAVFTFIDANHHIEEWTYMMPGDKPMHARLDLQRTNIGNSSYGF